MFWYQLTIELPVTQIAWLEAEEQRIRQHGREARISQRGKKAALFVAALDANEINGDWLRRGYKNQRALTRFEREVNQEVGT